MGSTPIRVTMSQEWIMKHDVPLDEQCWANKYMGTDSRENGNTTCKQRSTTDIGLCMDHYEMLKSFGREETAA